MIQWQVFVLLIYRNVKKNGPTDVLEVVKDAFYGHCMRERAKDGRVIAKEQTHTIDFRFLNEVY